MTERLGEEFVGHCAWLRRSMRSQCPDPRLVEEACDRAIDEYVATVGKSDRAIESPRAWMFRATKSWIQRLRRRRLTYNSELLVSLTAEPPVLEIKGPPGPLEKTVTDIEKRAILHARIRCAGFTKRQRVTTLLRLKGWSIRRIAKLLGVAARSIRKALEEVETGLRKGRGTG